MAKFAIDRADTALVIVDVQERLAAVMDQRRKVVGNCRRLIEGAKILGMPVVVTEQYPRGLGPTEEELRGALPVYEPVEKISFSCCGEPKFMDAVRPGEEEDHSRRHGDPRLCPADLHRTPQRRFQRAPGARRRLLPDEGQLAYRRRHDARRRRGDFVDGNGALPAARRGRERRSSSRNIPAGEVAGLCGGEPGPSRRRGKERAGPISSGCRCPRRGRASVRWRLMTPSMNLPP